jgi:Type II secretion system (T2SS), protein G
MLPDLNYRRFLLYLGLSMTTAAIISATAYLCAWLDYRGHPNFQPGQDMTLHDLKILSKDIEHYRERIGKLPASLADLEAEKMADEYVPLEDGWGRPFHYQVAGDRYELYSLGRDDKPGGVGPDADLYAGRQHSADELPTLWQFTTQLDTEGIQLTCLVAGILAFPLCLLGFKRGATNRATLVMVLVAHALTALFAVLAAGVISALHIPSGH